MSIHTQNTALTPLENSGVHLPTPKQLADLRRRFTLAVCRASKRRDEAQSDAEWQAADDDITDFSMRLARIADLIRRVRGQG